MIAELNGVKEKISLTACELHLGSEGWLSNKRFT